MLLNFSIVCIFIFRASRLLTIEFIFTLYHFKNKSLSASGARFSTHENFDNDWKYIQSLVAHIVEFKLTAAAAAEAQASSGSMPFVLVVVPFTDMSDVNMWLRECERVCVRMWCAHLIYSAMETDRGSEKNRNAHSSNVGRRRARETTTIVSAVSLTLLCILFYT